MISSAQYTYITGPDNIVQSLIAPEGKRIANVSVTVEHTPDGAPSPESVWTLQPGWGDLSSTASIPLLAISPDFRTATVAGEIAGASGHAGTYRITMYPLLVDGEPL